MYLFFDTETTGIPRNYKAPVTDLANWPRVVQLAFMQTDEKGMVLAAEEFIIKPEGFVIPADAARIHGITTEHALAQGVPMGEALAEFMGCLQKSTALVAHNMAYDENVLGAEFLRAKMGNPLPKAKRVCTMQSSTNYCAIPGPYGPKWPTLGQLHMKLFGQEMKDAHRRAGGCAGLCEMLFELRKVGVIR